MSSWSAPLGGCSYAVRHSHFSRGHSQNSHTGQLHQWRIINVECIFRFYYHPSYKIDYIRPIEILTSSYINMDILSSTPIVKPAQYSTPVMALNSILASNPHQGYPPKAQLSPHSLARLDVKMQAFFATCASILLSFIMITHS